MKKIKENVAYFDYDEDDWMEVFYGKVEDFFFWINHLLDNIRGRFFIKKEKRISFQKKYLKETSIREGCFYCLNFISFKLLSENRELLKNHFQYLLWTNPCLITGLVNLKTGQKEKVFIDKLMAEVFNFSKRNLINAVSKVLGSDLSLQNKALIVSYVAKNTDKEKRDYFLHFFRETFKKMGDPIKRVVEEITKEKL